MPVDAPFTLRPHLAERVWGGSRFGAGIGEAWDLSSHPHGESVVADGPFAGSSLAKLVATDPSAFGGSIDLLAKRLDCAESLSVQVHPTEGDPKTEAWVVLAAEPGAGVYLGFRDHPTEDEVRTAALDGSLTDLLNFVELAEGDAVFVPAGTVHAIGGGLVLFELQQSSDATYRLFDWGRTDRELHLDAALSCSDLAPPPPRPEPVALGAGQVRLVGCEYFVIDRLSLDDALEIDPGRGWVAILGVTGRAALGNLTIEPGTTAIVPAAAGRVLLTPDGEFTALRYGPPPTS